MQRSTAVKIAAVISFLVGCDSFITSLPYIMRGAAAVNQDGNSPPYAVLFAALIFALIRVLAAYGTWHNQRWSLAITLLASVADAVTSAPGILFAPTTAFWVAATGSTLLNILVIVLCLWRDTKRVQRN